MPPTRTGQTTQRGGGRGGGRGGSERGRGGTRASSFQERGGSSAANRNRVQRGGASTGGHGAGNGGKGGNGAGGSRQPEALNEDEANVVHPSILAWHRRLGMSADATRLAIQSMKAQASGRDVLEDTVTELDVIQCMERHCIIMQNKPLLDLLDGGPDSTTGVVQSISKINQKLPTITPLLVMSDEVEDRGKLYLREATRHAFLSEAVPSYDATHQEIFNAVMALAKNKPAEVGSNGKHLLAVGNPTGRQSVTKVIKDRINELRQEMRNHIHESIEEEPNLRDLVEKILGTTSDMKPTWAFVKRVALWRRTGTTEGCIQEDDPSKWNGKFWTEVDSRVKHLNGLIRDGQADDADKLQEAETYEADILTTDEERFGEVDLPEQSNCDVQQQFTDIFRDGLDSNV